MNPGGSRWLKADTKDPAAAQKAPREHTLLAPYLVTRYLAGTVRKADRPTWWG